MKVRGGRLKKKIEIEAAKWVHVEVSCRKGSEITVRGTEVDGDDFSVYILRSKDVKTAPIIGTVLEYEDGKALWSEEKTSHVDHTYTVEERDKIYVIFDNYHARSKYKMIEIEVSVEHPPLEVGDEPLRESFEVDAKYIEVIDVSVNQGDTLRVFGRVTKGKDITVHVLSKLYETPDTYHLDKAYWKKEKTEEIDVEYHCTKTEPLLIVFDNQYSLRTTKTIDVSVQLMKGDAPVDDGMKTCRFCSAKIESNMTFCPHCGGKQ